MKNISTLIFDSKDKENYKNKELTLLLLVAYFFSVVTRLLLLFSDGMDYEIVFNPDGCLYGFYAKELIKGVDYPFVSEYMPGYLIYFVHKITNLNVSTILFYLPVFTSSLIVFPIILIGKIVKQIEVSFFASIFVSISIGYYNRTYFGYYDTDQLNLFFPLMILFSMFGLIERQNAIYTIIGIISIFLYQYWYHSHKAILFGIVGFYMIYVIVFARENKVAKYSVLFFAIALLGSIYELKYIAAGLAVFTLLFFTFKNKISNRVLTIVLSVLTIFTFIFGAFKYSDRFIDYLNKENSYKIEIKSGDILEFKATLATVAENKNVDFKLLSVRTIGHPLFLVLGLIGFFIASYFYRVYLLLIPLLLIGFLSFKTGMRFTYYSAFPIALGLFNIFIYLKNYLYYFFSVSEKAISFFIKTVVMLLAIYIMNSNIFHEISLLLSKDEYRALNQLSKKEKINRNDYVLAWWDYGWPIWYITGANTVVDNGLHHKDNYFISKTIFAKNSKEAYKYALFTIDNFKEARKNGFGELSDYVFKKLSIDSSNLKNVVLNHISKHNGKNYIFFNDRYLKILGTIYDFSNFDLKSGKKLYNELLIIAKNKKIFK